MKLINLTPHEITCGEVRIPASGDIARVTNHTVACGTILGIPLFESRSVGLVGVPDPKEGVSYIVPSKVREALPKRRDLLSPARLIRDRAGAVVACLGLEINPE